MEGLALAFWGLERHTARRIDKGDWRAMAKLRQIREDFTEAWDGGDTGRVHGAISSQAQLAAGVMQATSGGDDVDAATNGG